MQDSGTAYTRQEIKQALMTIDSEKLMTLLKHQYFGRQRLDLYSESGSPSDFSVDYSDRSFTYVAARQPIANVFGKAIIQARKIVYVDNDNAIIMSGVKGMIGLDKTQPYPVFHLLKTPR